MANSGGFQEQVKHLGELVGQFDQMPNGPQKTAGKELIQLLMDVHAQGLERVMEIIFESGEAGSTLIDRLGKDEIAGGLFCFIHYIRMPWKLGCTRRWKGFVPDCANSPAQSILSAWIRARSECALRRAGTVAVLQQMSCGDWWKTAYTRLRPISSHSKFSDWKSLLRQALLPWIACSSTH